MCEKAKKEGNVMERKLKALFDFQKFEQNKRLSKMIDEANSSTDGELDDEDLSFVAAAGETYVPENEGKTNDN